ncbi:MAG: DUF5686 family protein [Porphyromonas sp.]|nr:DUF5686 family protein [Porphyromonas sp.]
MIPNLTVERSRIVRPKDTIAYNLIKLLIDEEALRMSQMEQDFTYRKTDQLTISLSKISKSTNFLEKIVPFFHDYTRKSPLTQEEIIPLSQRQRISKMGYNAKRRKTNERVYYTNLVGIDADFDLGDLSANLEQLFPRIDLFNNSVRILESVFVSPLSPKGENYYKYYLTDTIISRGRVVQVVEYYPLDYAAQTFKGQLYITATNPPKLLRSSIQVSNSTNLNFVEDLHIQQDFKEVAPQIWHKEREVIDASFKVYWDVLSLEATKERHFDDFDFVNPDPELINASNSFSSEIKNGSGENGVVNSMKAEELLSTTEGLKLFVDKIQSNSSTGFIMDLVEIFSRSYVHTSKDPNKVYGGSKFDIGPIHKTLQYNSHEGVRVRLGGRTTAFLSKHLFFDVYWAYGLIDEVQKYDVTASYSFAPKRYFREEYPRHEISLTKRYDMFTPGQTFDIYSRDNILLDVGTSYLTDRSYRDILRTTYTNDLSQNISFSLFVQYLKDFPTGDLEYMQVMRDETMIKLPFITDTSFGVQLRWAPGERILEGSMQRQSHYKRLQNNVPVIQFSHETAFKALGGDFNRSKTELSVEQRLWLGTYGRLDYKAAMGKIWNAVPFPMLYTPPINRSLVLHENAFQLLEPLEYVMDEWAVLFTRYHMQGLIFNQVPWLKKIDLRGVLIANFLFGNSTSKNSQATSQEIFVLPTISTEMHYTPYFEVGFGLENIFKVARIDLYRRVTSQGPHSRSPWAVRGTLRLKF